MIIPNSAMTKAELLKAAYDYSVKYHLITEYSHAQIVSFVTPQKLAEAILDFVRNRDMWESQVIIFLGKNQVSNLNVATAMTQYYQPNTSFSSVKTGFLGLVMGYITVTDAAFDENDRWFGENDIMLLWINDNSEAFAFLEAWQKGEEPTIKETPKSRTFVQRGMDFIKRLRTYPA